MGSCPGLFLINLGDFQRKCHIVEKISLIQKIKLLENHPHLPSHETNFRIRHLPKRLSLEEHLSAGRHLQIIDTPNQCRLAGARKSDDAVYRTLFDIKIDIVECYDRSGIRLESLSHMLETNDRIALCHIPSPLSLMQKF